MLTSRVHRVLYVLHVAAVSALLQFGFDFEGAAVHSRQRAVCEKTSPFLPSPSCRRVMSAEGSVTVGGEEEMKMNEHTGLPVLSQGAVIAHNVGVGTQHLHSAPPHQVVAPPMPRVSEATERQSFQQLFESMQAQMQAQTQLFMAQQHQLQQQIHAMQRQAEAAATEQQRTAASARRQTHPLPPYPITPAVGEYSAGASLPLPPRVPAPHRASYGRPSTPAALAPFTPVAQRAAAVPQAEAKDRSDDEVDNAAADVQAEDERMPPRDKRMEQVRKTMLTSVKPFHGRTKQDTYTVIDWVEKLDTEFSIHMGERQTGRMDVVRSLLAGQALKWANRRVAEMNAIGEEAEWSAIRADFIDAHLGSSTIETFKAELRALRLGTGDNDCKSPSELNTQFDRLAELAYPMALGLADRRADAAMATVLGDEYRRIVADSVPFLWRNIERSVAPTTLEEWKAALARHWSAERTIENMRKQLRPSYEQQSQRGGGGAARGSRGRVGGNSASPHPSLNAMLDSNEREEGEPDTQQLSAAFTTNQRGGSRGGFSGRRRGRGGGSGVAMSAEKQQLYHEGRCFTCKKTGHIAKDCLGATTTSPSASQSNE
jgi:hypothetical protein